MLDGLPILIVEDDPDVGQELVFAVEILNGRAIGPVSTVKEAIGLLETEYVAAAILDATLLDGEVTPLALQLIAESVPFLMHSGTGIPAALAEKHPDLPVVFKPARTETLLAALERLIVRP